MIAAISTALRPRPEIRQRCEDSIKAQTLPVHHIYIVDDWGGYHLENLSRAVHSLPPDTIVLSVDGDDWLSNPRAAEIVNRAYAAGAWMTWGQYELHDQGRRKIGHCRDAANRRNCRREPYYASHLKTFRAGLFQQIDPAYLKDRHGVWLQECCDMAFMLPMLEMADDRGVFIPEVLYGYHYTDRRLRGHDSPGSKLHKNQLVTRAYVQSRPVCPRLATAPW